MATKKKAPAKKTAAKKPTEDAALAPMDPDAPEVQNAAPVANRQRNAYALDTLIAEVTDVFPETTTYEVSGYNQFNTALDVAFFSEEFERLDELLALIADDIRVKEVLVEESDHTILVSLHSNLRLQDSRDPFNLAEAWAILAEKYGDAR